MGYDLAAMIRRARPRTKAVAPGMIEPTATIERELYAILRPVIEFWRREIEETILPAYDRNLGVGIVLDDAPQNVRSAIAGVADGATRLVVSLGPQLERWIVRVERWHAGRWTSTVRSVSGIDLAAFIASLSATTEVQAHAQWAASLIRNVSDDIRRQVETQAFEALAEQRPRRALAKDLAQVIDGGRKRALLIARDQTNKLSGKLDQLRHREAGIEEYRWRTARDDRVRPTHQSKEGKVFRWDKPPADTGHPRTEINCRCTAQPWIPLLDEIG